MGGGVVRERQREVGDAIHMNASCACYILISFVPFNKCLLTPLRPGYLFSEYAPVAGLFDW